MTALFDEDGYLSANPDVAQAVRNGDVKSGWAHFLAYGHLEGRPIAGFDPEFYVRAYPLAAAELAAKRVRSTFEHYWVFGRARGYLPNPLAMRADHAAGIASKFGGFWFDQANALDVLAGKVAVGQVSAEQALQLRQWIRDGFVVLEGAVPEEILVPARADFDRAWAGEMPEARFECEAVAGGRAVAPWTPAMNEVSAKAVDLHFHSAKLRDLMFAPAVMGFLKLLFEAPPYATQSLGFWLGSGQAGHQDTAYVAYSLPRQFCASWIALEDVAPGGGELFYVPGSHRLPEFVYAGRFKGVHEAQRLTGGRVPVEEFEGHVAYLEERIAAAGMKREVFVAKKGDVLFWHADLVHGGGEVKPGVTRKSFVTHYCPMYVAPLSGEGVAMKLFRHGEGFYSSAYYSE